MSRCDELRPFLDGETTPWRRWRMERHLRRCPACLARKAADEQILTLLREEASTDTPEEAAAIARVSRAWQAGVPGVATAHVSRTPVRSTRRWMTASAAAGVAVTVFAGLAITAPGRALARVAGAMEKVQRFHLSMQVPEHGVRYEAWGDRAAGARVEEWEGKRLAMVIVDDGRRLRQYSPVSRLVRESKTHLKRAFRAVAGFNATKLLRQVARGRFLEEQEWLGKPSAREVARIIRDGREQRRIQVDLEQGMFARMIVYADARTDRLTQANLYSGSTDPDEQPFARVFFSYPERVDPALLRWTPPQGTRVRYEESEMEIP